MFRICFFIHFFSFLYIYTVFDTTVTGHTETGMGAAAKVYKGRNTTKKKRKGKVFNMLCTKRPQNRARLLLFLIFDFDKKSIQNIFKEIKHENSLQSYQS